MALKGLLRFEEALECFNLVLDQDPTHKKAQQMVKKVTHIQRKQAQEAAFKAKTEAGLKRKQEQEKEVNGDEEHPSLEKEIRGLGLEHCIQDGAYSGAFLWGQTKHEVHVFYRAGDGYVYWDIRRIWEKLCLQHQEVSWKIIYWRIIWV